MIKNEGQVPGGRREDTRDHGLSRRSLPVRNFTRHELRTSYEVSLRSRRKHKTCTFGSSAKNTTRSSWFDRCLQPCSLSPCDSGIALFGVLSSFRFPHVFFYGTPIFLFEKHPRKSWSYHTCVQRSTIRRTSGGGKKDARVLVLTGTHWYCCLIT